MPPIQKSPAEITFQLKQRAAELGFHLQGVSPAVAPAGAVRLEQWLARGYGGEMRYLAERREAYAHPEHVLQGVRSLLLLAMPYSSGAAAQPQPNEGRVARYAWGSIDYHDLIRPRLHELADLLRELAPGAATRGVVDTAPLLEREFAQLAGLGWVGKNTLLLNRTVGSYFFLAALLTDLELSYDQPHRADHCGSCTACLDACPTDAFPEPYVLDASRCISYLTIEHRGPMAENLRGQVGDWLFGCDVCQEVCPWNRQESTEPLLELQPTEQLNPVDCRELFALTDDEFRERFRRTPLWRAHRRGLLRNAAIVLGNQADPAAAPALEIGLQDAEPLVRAACAWALGRLDSSEASAILSRRQAIEADPSVRSEIEAALETC